MKFSKKTYVEFPKKARELRKFQKDNCAKLADILESLADSQHNQDTWAVTNKTHPCKTVGCALGWAAMSNQFPGLQYKFDRFIKNGILPVINGSDKYNDHPEGWDLDWDDAGVKFFGRDVLDDVFYDFRASKQETIAALIKASK